MTCVHVLFTMLALLLLLVNVYDTYKALKASSRLSARAGAHRKRTMKGCMCTWVVWGSWSLLENFGDRTFGWVIPFYGTGKSVLLVLLILGRTRATEPIYLYLLRPAIKSQAHMFDIAFYILDATLSILLLSLLAPSLFLYEHALRPLFAMVAPHLPSMTKFSVSSLILRRGSQVQDRLRSRTADDMRVAVDAANSIYEELEKLQDSVRRRRRNPADTYQGQEGDELAEVPQLRIRRKNVPSHPHIQPRHTLHTERPPAVPPKQTGNGPAAKLSLPPSPPPPAYSEQSPHTPEKLRYKVYPMLPVDKDLAMSLKQGTTVSTPRESMLIPHDPIYTFPTLATIRPPSDDGGENGTTLHVESANTLRLEDLESESRYPSLISGLKVAESSRAALGTVASIRESVPAVPRKGSIDGSSVFSHIGEETDSIFTETESAATDDMEESKQKRRRVAIEPRQPRSRELKPRLGPPTRIPAGRQSSGQSVETYRRTVSASAANGKGKARDYGEGVELVPDRLPHPSHKSQTNGDVRRQNTRKRADVEAEDQPRRVKRAQSRDDLKKPASKRRVAEPIDEDVEVEEVADRPLTRSTTKQRVAAYNALSTGNPAEGVATRTRTGLGRQGAISTRGGRGRGRSVSGV